MKILSLKILEKEFKKENSEVYQKCKTINNSDKYNNYCTDINNIRLEDNVNRVWSNLVKNYLSKILESIYFENDQKFNCENETCIKLLIQEISELNIDEDFQNAFSTACGDIHESFRAYGGKGGAAKELGQFFTPRHLINLIFHGIGLNQLITNIGDDITIYDPCMGTAGFLTRLYKLIEILPENIYGCETERDTIKFGEMSTILTTGAFKHHFLKCNSLSHENNFIRNKKFNVIVTNPPFGTSMNYKELKDEFEEKIKDINFKDIYPLKTNNGACLFVQHCVYMLKEGGVCAIVLPDGELFEGNSKWSKSFRKWLSEQVNIRTILKVASGTFEHAGVKTNVIVFTKDGPTKNIRFMETSKECNEVKDMFSITSEELKTTGYSLDVGEYLVEENDNYDVPMVTLGEVCVFEPKSKRNAKYGNKTGNYPFYKSSLIINSYINEPDYTEESIIIGDGGSANINYSTAFSTSDHCYVFRSSDERITNNYIYTYIRYNLYKLEKYYNGSGLKNISKENIKKFKIPLPSLEIQQQIVDELSGIETSIETIETRISQLKTEKNQYKKYARKAEIKELLKGCDQKMLGDVCEFKGYKYIKRTDMIDGEYKVIGGGKKQSGYHNKFNKDANTILCSGTGSYAGYISKYSTPVWASESFSIHSNNITILNELYLYLYLKNIQEYLYTKRPASGGQPHMYPRIIGKIKIPLPSPEIQQQCISIFEQKEEYLKSIDEKIKQETEYIEQLRNLGKDVISSYC